MEADDNDVMAASHGSTQLVEGDLRSALDKLRIQSSRRVECSIADVSPAETAIRTLLPVLALAALGSAVVLSKLSSARHRASTLEQLVTAKDEFVASVSHELRTPLTGVLGFAVELEERIQASGDREESEMIAIVADQARQAAYLVEDLLVAARSDIGRLEIVRKSAELGPLAESVLREGGFRHLSELNSIKVDAKSVVAYADPYRVRQIVRNLLTNADRYGRDEVSVNIHQAGNIATLQVTDNGPSVPAGQREEIFEPYVNSATGSQHPDSVGLGLAVARRLACLMDGKLTCRSDQDRTVFELMLPAVAPDRPVGDDPRSRTRSRAPTSV